MPRLDPYRFDPEQHVGARHRPVRPPSWATFENRTQFTGMRSFRREGNRLVGIEEDLDLHVREFGLGRVIWPHLDCVFAENFDEAVEAIRRRGLWLFDLWGHVPGSPPEGPWAHVVPPPGTIQRLREALGDRFLGIDNGEQDYRYFAAGYADQQCPAPQDRFRKYFDGVVVDWRTLRHLSAIESEALAGWWRRQDLRLAVDFSSGLNFYPDLTLLDVHPPRHAESRQAIEDTLRQLARLGGKDAILRRPRSPENHCSPERSRERLLAGLHSLADFAAPFGIVLHLQHHPWADSMGWWRSGQNAEDTLALVAEAGCDHLRFALSVGHAAMEGPDAQTLAQLAGDRLGLLLWSAPLRDAWGQCYDAHRPLVGSGLDLDALAPLARLPACPNPTFSMPTGRPGTKQSWMPGGWIAPDGGAEYRGFAGFQSSCPPTRRRNRPWPETSSS